MFVADMFKSRCRLEAENIFLRHQLNISLRRASPRLRLHGSDRAVLEWMTRIWPNLLDISHVVQRETTPRWHRTGFNSGVAPSCPAKFRRPLGVERFDPLSEVV